MARKKTNKAIEETPVIETVVEDITEVEELETPEVEETDEVEIPETEDTIEEIEEDTDSADDADAPEEEEEELPEIEEEEEIGEKKDYMVLMAAPAFFVIDVDGKKKTILASNSYKRGDIVQL